MVCECEIKKNVNNTLESRRSLPVPIYVVHDSEQKVGFEKRLNERFLLCVVKISCFSGVLCKIGKIGYEIRFGP